MLKILRIILFFSVIIVISGLFAFNYYFSAPINSGGQNIKFVIEKGEGVKEIAEDLKQNGLLKYKESFLIYIWLTNKEKYFQAGEHILNPGLNLKEIIKVLTSGETLKQERAIKIIEGWNLNDIAGYLEKEGLFKKSDFFKFAGEAKTNYRAGKNTPSLSGFAADFNFLKDKPAGSGLEGYLFPDTYRIFKDASAKDVVLKMLANFDKKLSSEMRAEISRQKKTIYEIVTMASLIEREVKTEKDMKIASGILWKRIANGQPLQLDATLTYVLGDEKIRHSLEETKIDSPYNTYKYKGLPPGPIASPGLKALRAAIYPENSEYNYFLVRPDNGEIIYGKTFAEHAANKRKYLK
jgi:UPF0755 protein